MLVAQGNLSNTYEALGRFEDSLRLRQEVYTGYLKFAGVEHPPTLRAGNNYAIHLLELQRFKEAKRVLRKVTPVAQRVLGTENDITLSLREDLSRATLDGESSAEEKREALRVLEDVAGVRRRVLGPAHPDTLYGQRQLERYRRRFPRK